MGEIEMYKYFQILEAGPSKQVEVKEKNKKAYLRGTRKQPKTKLYCRINTRTEHLVSYSRPFLKSETNRQENKKTNNDAKGIKSHRWRSQIICAKKRRKRTWNYIKTRIHKTQQKNRCRLCGDRDETINRIIRKRSNLAQRKYKTRHYWVGK